MISDWEVDGSCQLSYLCFDHVTLLPTSHQYTPANVADWFNTGNAMCYHSIVIIHVENPKVTVIRERHRVPLAGSCLSLYSLHVLNRDVNIINTNIISQLYMFPDISYSCFIFSRFAKHNWLQKVSWRCWSRRAIKTPPVHPTPCCFLSCRRWVMHV